jgi:hypothetical protein
MGEVEFTDLRLSFKQRGDREYDVTAAIDGGATATTTFTIPMSDEALQDAIRNLSETRSALATPATRKIVPVTEHGVTAQEFGTTLANALITGDVATMFDEARGKGAVRVRLDMTTEPELLRIPWEFLRRNGRDLASQRDCTVVRELETAEPARPRLVEDKIRMLGVIANPRHDLDVEGEKRRVTDALGKCKDQVELDWLEDCTFKSLQRKLQDPYHILHFVGHSAFTDQGDSIVLLSDENGMPKEQSADSLAQLIGRQSSLQLVVFNSCDGARTKLDDPFASIATMLVQQGQSAVIAMQFEISDPAAKAFAEELYFSLIDRRYPIDAAVAEARIAMLDVNQIEFATPVLFLRPGFVELFTFNAPSAAAASPTSTAGAAAAPLVSAGALEDPPPPNPAPISTETPDKPKKSKRWMVVAGVGLAVVIAGVVAVVAMSSGDDDAAVDTTPPITDYEPITDFTGALTVNVPSDWTAERDTHPLTADQSDYEFDFADRTEVPWIEASESVTGLDNTYETPGVIITVLPPQDSLDDTLAQFAPPDEDCSAGSIIDYSNGGYTGRTQRFTECGDTGATIITVALEPDDASFTALIELQIVSDNQEDVLDRMVESLDVASQ